MQVANQVERNVLAKVGHESRSPATHAAPQVDQAALAANVENIVMAKVEKRLGSLEVTLGGRVEEVAKDVRDQETTLRDMFSEQMQRIEELRTPKETGASDKHSCLPRSSPVSRGMETLLCNAPFT